MIGAVVFDVGEFLVDETREYGTWADWLGVPRHVFSAVFGAVIARGQDYRETFQVFRPGFDLDKARQQRADEGKPEWFGDEDLYPDVRAALTGLRDMSLWVGIAGNQTARAGSLLRDLGLPADMIATSDDWEVAKPDSGSVRRRVIIPSIPQVVRLAQALDLFKPGLGDVAMVLAFTGRGGRRLWPCLLATSASTGSA